MFFCFVVYCLFFGHGNFFGCVEKFPGWGLINYVIVMKVLSHNFEVSFLDYFYVVGNLEMRHFFKAKETVGNGNQD